MNDILSWETLKISCTAMVGMWLFWQLLHVRTLLKKFMSGFITVLRVMPGTAGLIEGKLAEARTAVEGLVAPDFDKDLPRFPTLPQQGVEPEQIIQTMKTLRDRELGFRSGKFFGGIYYKGEEHEDVLAEAYNTFSRSNALYPGVFPGLKKFESEVVSMCVDMFHGDSNTSGTLTAGGTESLIMAVKTYRDYALETKGIREPELIMCVSAHPALLKAGHYLGVKVVEIPMGDDYAMDLKLMQRAITRNTIMIVASAPQFPHGVMDNIPEIAAIAQKKNIPCHVDACLGGFLIPFLAELGHLKMPFDFRVAGVTSISADLHKYGMTHKGSSCILYATPELRRLQYFIAVDWPGGVYCSPSVAGSRNGGLIAASWASLVHVGRQGFLDMAQDVHEACTLLCDGVRKIAGLYVLGEPVGCIVAVGARGNVNILQVADALEKLGWDVARMQKPDCIHFAISQCQVPVVPQLLKDLSQAVETVRGVPMDDSGMAAVYGMASKLPHRGIVKDLLAHYMDSLYKVPAGTAVTNPNPAVAKSGKAKQTPTKRRTTKA